MNGLKDSSTPKVVLLLSEKSSGSTALQYELCKHPAVNLVRFTEHNDHETLYWLKAASLLQRPRTEYSEGRPFFRVRSARRSITELLVRNVAGYSPPTDDEALVSGGWDALCEEYRPVFFEKSPHHLQHWAALAPILGYIETTDHDVRLLGLVRNPMSTIYSAWRRWLTPPESRQFIWAQSYRNLLLVEAMVAPGRFHLVRYEDLVINPHESMRTVCGFLDLDYHDYMGGDIHGRSLRNWDLDQEFALQLDANVMLVAQRYGYTTADLQNPAKKGLSSWRRTQIHVLRVYRAFRSRLMQNLIRSVTRGKRTG